MPEQITCPGCGRRLKLPSGTDAPLLTCPRCLAQITNPGSTEVTSETPSAAPSPAERIQATPTAARAEPLCPNCGRGVKEEWLFCPYCNEPLKHGPRRHTSNVDVDVRRDSSGTGLGLILLAVLGAIGLVVTLVSSFGALKEGEPRPFAFTLVAVFVLGLISAGAAAVKRKTHEQPVGIGRLAFNTLTLIGGLMTGWLALCLAGIVFFFVVCLAGGGRGW